MSLNRPQTLRPCGAANSGKPDAGGRGLGNNMADFGGSIRCRRTYSKIARPLYAFALFWAPLGAFAHVPPTSGDVGFLNAGGLKTPGSIEVIP